MGFLNNIHFDPITFIGYALAIIIGVTVHEFMHAYTAWRLGDNTALRLGRITLNPVAHFDPLGAVMFLLMAIGVPVIAWGRPVPVNPAALRNGRKGMALVAFAGPASNLVIATLFAIPGRLSLNFPTEVDSIISSIVYVNLLLFSFNLIPIPPLDGYNILTGLLSTHWAMLLEPLRRYGPAILLIVVFVLPQFLQVNIYSSALYPIIQFTGTLITGHRFV